MTRAWILALMGLNGCATLGAAAKDPAAAVAQVKAETAKIQTEAKAVRAATAIACAQFAQFEAEGKVPAGPAKDDLDLFCALDAATR